ncbi:hypothetical protein BDZ91DRAFT_102590 [Kalaharituber pfeilii]|nr:hypothetical protein BDZ91DRAFT_102590 [Kalaharituber pfeilii]
MSSKMHWYCTVCDKLFPPESQKTHLQGRKHQAKLNPPTVTYWHCKVCNRYFVAQNKEPHESGPKHLAKLHQVERAKELRDKILPNIKDREAGKWTCDVCSTSMDSKSREAHLGGRKHARAVVLQMKKEEKEQLATPGPAKGNGTWECDICLRSMTWKARQAHLEGKKHARVVIARLRGPLKKVETEKPSLAKALSAEKVVMEQPSVTKSLGVRQKRGSVAMGKTIFKATSRIGLAQTGEPSKLADTRISTPTGNLSVKKPQNVHQAMQQQMVPAKSKHLKERIRPRIYDSRGCGGEQFRPPPPLARPLADIDEGSLAPQGPYKVYIRFGFCGWPGTQSYFNYGNAASPSLFAQHLTKTGNHVYKKLAGMQTPSLGHSVSQRLRPRKPRERKWKRPLPPPPRIPCQICKLARSIYVSKKPRRPYGESRKQVKAWEPFTQPKLPRKHKSPRQNQCLSPKWWSTNLAGKLIETKQGSTEHSGSSPGQPRL